MIAHRLVRMPLLCLATIVLFLTASTQAQAEPAWLSPEDPTRQARVQHDQARGVETGKLLILMNRDMALALDRSTFRLHGLFDPATNKDFVSISDTAPAVDLVAGLILLTPDRKQVKAIGFDRARRTHAWRKTDQGIELSLTWQGADAPSEPGVLDVVATVSLGSTGMSRWSCRMVNRSKDHGLVRVEFPVIGSLRAWDDDDPVDFNAFGDPRPTDTSRQDGSFLACSEPAPSFRFGYQAYYGSRGGVYYLPEDPDYLWKDTYARTAGDSRTVTFSHTFFCTNSYGEQVKTFDATYPVTVGIFHGDWYTAARIYRRWAIRQPWCAKGTLAERDDVPEWFKQRDFFQQGAGTSIDNYRRDHLIARNYGRPIGIWNTHWMNFGFDDRYPDYFPPKIGEEAFKQAVARGHAMGLYYTPYINVILYAYDAPSFNAAVVVPAAFKWLHDGSYRTVRFKYGKKDLHAVVMCPAAKFWQDKLSEMARKLIQEYDCDGIYFDQVDPYCRQCGDPSHGHELGGGNAWTEGMREVFRRVRRESMAAGKRITLIGEYWRERYIGDYDAALTLGGRHDSKLDFIRSVVYHDYLATVCTNMGDGPLIPFVGSLFVAGAETGPLGVASKCLLDTETPDEKALGFLHYLSDCRHEFGFKYINLGARLRDPEILTELPMIDRGKNAKKMPAVVTSAWQAGDGDVGCFFMNISEEPREFEYEIDLARCALESMGTYNVTKHELGTTTELEEESTGRLTRTDSLQPGKLFMIEFSLRK